MKDTTAHKVVTISLIEAQVNHELNDSLGKLKTLLKEHLTGKYE